MSDRHYKNKEIADMVEMMDNLGEEETAELIIAQGAELAALQSRLEEAERIVKVVSDGGCLVCLEGGVGCNVHEGNDCLRRLIKQWRRGSQVDGGGE